MLRALVLLLLSSGCASSPQMGVHRVELHRAGLVTVEHRGVIDAGGFALPVDPHAANSLVVRALDGAVVASELRENVVHVPAGRERVVRYVAERAPYEVRYRLSVEGDRASLSARALVHNTTPFEWRDVEITLATDDPRGPGGMVWAQVPAPGDADGDHVLDAGDRCVDAAESYDGNLDDDGCPDVVIPSEGAAADEGAVRVSFQRDGAAPDEEALSVIAALLAGTPTVRVRVVVHGRADEVDGWPLAEGRAQAVIEGLVTRGVARERLGFSLAFTTEEPFATFEIEVIEDAPAVRTEPVLDPVLDEHRQVAAHHTITVARGGEVEVELGAEEVRATPILLYRAGLSEASHTELYRAIQLTLADGIPRLPGTVEIVIDGERVGEAALDGAALDGGLAWLPYALEAECAITVEVTQSVDPIVALSLHGSMLSGRVRYVQRTHYEVEGVVDTPLVIAHRRTPGMALREVPGAHALEDELVVSAAGALTLIEEVEGIGAEDIASENFDRAPWTISDELAAEVVRVAQRAAAMRTLREEIDAQERALEAAEATLSELEARAAPPRERRSARAAQRAAEAALGRAIESLEPLEAEETEELLDASDD